MSELEVKRALESGKGKLEELSDGRKQGGTGLKVQKKISDESHGVMQAQLLEAIQETGDAVADIPAILSHTVDEILRQINPVEHTEENDAQYRIKYRGYQEFYRKPYGSILRRLMKNAMR